MSSTVRKFGSLTTQLRCATSSGTRRGGASQREERSIEQRARGDEHGINLRGSTNERYARMSFSPTPRVREACGSFDAGEGE
eukprot:scaffold76016_cov75-Phaeocystis_antarctica.AAC.3